MGNELLGILNNPHISPIFTMEGPMDKCNSLHDVIDLTYTHA